MKGAALLPPPPSPLAGSGPAAPSAERPVGKRIDLPCEIVGFQRPPCRLHITFRSAGEHWILMAHAEPGRAGAAAAWLEAHRPAEVRIDPGVAPRGVMAAFERLPQAWATLLSSVRVNQIQLTADGRASIYVEGTRDRFEDFLDTLRVADSDVRARPTLPSHGAAQLTPRQFEVLARAVALGYYEIPHLVDLRTIARKLGTSHAAAAGLLRRAEAVVIKDYVDSMAESEWEKAGREPAAVPSP